MSKKRIFIDMDGTLARFHDEVQYLERMFEKGFFENLKPFENIVLAVSYFKKEHPDVELFILSACVDGEPPYCKEEKNTWIDKLFPNEFDSEHRIFTSVGKAKSEYIPGGITKGDYLIDDYNANLEQWKRDGGVSIKCKNNINNKGLVGPKWNSYIIDNSLSPYHIIKSIESVMNTCFQFSQQQVDDILYYLNPNLSPYYFLERQIPLPDEELETLHEFLISKSYKFTNGDDELLEENDLTEIERLERQDGIENLLDNYPKYECLEDDFER